MGVWGYDPPLAIISTTVAFFGVKAGEIGIKALDRTLMCIIYQKD